MTASHLLRSKAGSAHNDERSVRLAACNHKRGPRRCSARLSLTNADHQLTPTLRPRSRPQDVLNVVEKERPDGIIVQFGGQTPLKIATALQEALTKYPVKVRGRRATQTCLVNCGLWISVVYGLLLLRIVIIIV